MQFIPVYNAIKDIKQTNDCVNILTCLKQQQKSVTVQLLVPDLRKSPRRRSDVHLYKCNSHLTGAHTNETAQLQELGEIPVKS